MVARFARDTALLVVDDLQWLDRSSLDVLGALCRLGGDRPILVVATSRSREALTLVADDEFKMNGLWEIVQTRLVRRGVPVKMALNHGVSLSFYFDDPEGHQIEVYWSTGVVCRPRHGDPIDLTLPEEALWRDVGQLAARAGASSSTAGRR